MLELFILSAVNRMCSLGGRLHWIMPETISDNFFQHKWASMCSLWYCSSVHCDGQLRGRLPPSSWQREARTMACCVLPGWAALMMTIRWREKKQLRFVLSVTQQINCNQWRVVVFLSFQQIKDIFNNSLQNIWWSCIDSSMPAAICPCLKVRFVGLAVTDCGWGHDVVLSLNCTNNSSCVLWMDWRVSLVFCLDWRVSFCKATFF